MKCWQPCPKLSTPSPRPRPSACAPGCGRNRPHKRPNFRRGILYRHIIQYVVENPSSRLGPLRGRTHLHPRRAETPTPMVRAARVPPRVPRATGGGDGHSPQALRVNRFGALVTPVACAWGGARAPASPPKLSRRRGQIAKEGLRFDPMAIYVTPDIAGPRLVRPYPSTAATSSISTVIWPGSEPTPTAERA